ncbi:MAG: prephenate dehydrogenase [Candidatus Omnitrophica bacterium]|nr:prephenate dehydrogenase [Candidatus Omnitrophota bacterium]
MLLRPYLFKRVTIIGVGLMGGSLGMAIKKHGLAHEVIGLSHRQAALDEAVKIGAIDTPCLDVRKAVSNADLVILATPVESIIKLFSTINPYLKRGCLITDVGSAKARIVENGEKLLSVPSSFVGSHPMAGSEKKGVANAADNLFEGSVCIMTPTEKTNQVARQKIKLFWTKLGMGVKLLSPEEHDEILAYVSHLPHLLAYGLISGIPENFLEYASTGLKDTSRVAASSPKMWSDICIANSKNVLKALDQCVEYLAHFRKAIVSQDQKSLLQYFTQAQEKRTKLS